MPDVPLFYKVRFEGEEDAYFAIDLAHDPGTAVLMVHGRDDDSGEPAELCFVLDTAALAGLSALVASAVKAAVRKDVEAGPKPVGGLHGDIEGGGG